MTTTEDLLVQIEKNTRATAQLLALSVGPDVRRKLAELFDTPQKQQAYAASDGERSAREVARLANTTHPTVGRWWDEWKAAGVALEVEGGTTRGTLELGLFGLTTE